MPELRKNTFTHIPALVFFLQEAITARKPLATQPEESSSNINLNPNFWIIA
jgi:hypothetical protein